MSIFQSTSSVWRTTLHYARIYMRHPISIHVLRVEDDPYSRWECNPFVKFQSTSCAVRRPISIHVLRVEDDCDSVL